MPTRSARTAWNGGLQDGSGQVELSSSGVGTFDVSWPSRAEEANGKTSPEELIAAAHGACFAMALSNVLAEGGTPPERLEISAAAPAKAQPAPQPQQYDRAEPVGLVPEQHLVELTEHLARVVDPDRRAWHAGSPEGRQALAAARSRFDRERWWPAREPSSAARRRAPWASRTRRRHCWAREAVVCNRCS